MRVFKNLFGDGSKIHGDNIVIGEANNHVTLGDIFNGAYSIKSPYCTPASRGDFDELVNSYDSNLPNRTFYWFIENPKVSLGGPFHGSAWLIEGLKNTDNYGWQRATTYSNEGIKIVARAKFNGTWTPWQQICP